MGYALQLRIARLADVTDELAAPTLTVDELDDQVRGRLDDRIADNWGLLATTVADAIAGGGGTPEGTLVDYVVAVIAHHSHAWLPLDYSSASGEWFHDVLLGTHLADLVGPDAVEHLVARPLAGLQPPELPSWGHLTADEVAVLADGDLTVDQARPEAATLTEVAAVIARAARFERALVTITS